MGIRLRRLKRKVLGINLAFLVPRSRNSILMYVIIVISVTLTISLMLCSCNHKEKPNKAQQNPHKRCNGTSHSETAINSLNKQ